MNFLKHRIWKIKMHFAFKWIEAEGLSVARIVQKAGTNYLVDAQGRFHKVGK